MSKGLFYIILTIFLVVGAGYLLLGKSDGNSNTISDGSGNAQVVKLSVQGANYVLIPNEVKKDIPVRIEADMAKMPGCSKSIVISAFNIRKTVSQTDNPIEFTTTKAGTFNIACSMNMYRGTFTVK